MDTLPTTSSTGSRSASTAKPTLSTIANPKRTRLA